LARVIDAGSWYAGVRPCYAGIIQSAPAQPEVAALIRRYSRSRESTRMRSGAREGSLTNFNGVGVVRWTDLASILRDCAHTHVLTAIERALARNAETWLASVGI
jgi:hypothetical protein